MKLLRRLICALSWHSWIPTVIGARALCECSFCGTRRWISLSCFDQRH